MAQRRAYAAAVLASLLAAGTASAQTSIPCPNEQNRMSVSPVLTVRPIGLDNAGADCAMWRTFFYLNWPALPNQRGKPDNNARFGVARPTVWETYRTEDEVFLPNGQKPPPWNDRLAPPELLAHPELPPDVAAEVQAGQARLLVNKTKISRTVIDVIGRVFADDPLFLRYIQQADGNILYDQQSQPAYYEISMNEMQFDYIVNNGLYNAANQVTYTRNNNIALPVGAIELKAAWKILTPAQAASGRFHTAKAYLLGPPLRQVTVGLVALHVFTGGGPTNIGMWGTFAQIDNVPLQGNIGPVPVPYSFNNPQCGAACKVNDPTTNPTQAAQVFPDDPLAARLTMQVQNMIKSYDLRNRVKSPWPYYKLINVQWSAHPIVLGNPPVKLPLPEGMPTTTRLTNPVEETFQQAPDVSCMTCHRAFASIAKNPDIASGFSFMFSHAR
jgi:hypothetical protein